MLTIDQISGYFPGPLQQRNPRGLLVEYLQYELLADYGYIEKILGMKRTEFLRRFNKRVEELDLNFLARDVEPFLFTPEQQERVLTFREYWNKIGNG